MIFFFPQTNYKFSKKKRDKKINLQTGFFSLKKEPIYQQNRANPLSINSLTNTVSLDIAD